MTAVNHPYPGLGQRAIRLSHNHGLKTTPMTCYSALTNYPLLYPEDTRSTWVRHWTAKRRVFNSEREVQRGAEHTALRSGLVGLAVLLMLGGASLCCCGVSIVVLFCFEIGSGQQYSCCACGAGLRRASRRPLARNPVLREVPLGRHVGIMIGRDVPLRPVRRSGVHRLVARGPHKRSVAARGEEGHAIGKRSKLRLDGMRVPWVGCERWRTGYGHLGRIRRARH